MENAPGFLPEEIDIGGQNRGGYRFEEDILEELPSSSLPSGIEDDSGYTDDRSEIRAGLIDDLLGPSYGSRYKDSGIHIHIGAVHYYRERSTQGLYVGPNPQGYAQHPPQPCHPLSKTYASSPASNLHRHSSAGHIRRTPRPYSDDFETIATRRPDTDTKDVQIKIQPEEAEAYSANNMPQDSTVNDTSLEGSLSRLRVTKSEHVINGMPSHLEVSMEMDGDDSVMWTGELKCVPSVPDLRPRPSAAAPPHRPKSVLYVNNVHIGPQRKPVSRDQGTQEVDYVNYNEPFSKAQPYRVASAGGSDGPQIHRLPTVGASNVMRMPSEHRMSGSFQPSKDLNAISKLGGKTWKSTTNLQEHGHIARVNGIGTRCSTFHCIPEGLYFDIEDENEKAHIKECLLTKGKSGNWVIMTLQNHPLNRFCLEVKSQDEVLTFPVMRTHKKKYKIDPSRKGFKCICKLIEFYKKHKLPSCNVNLGTPFPRSLIPPAEAEADCSDEVKLQYAGIRL